MKKFQFYKLSKILLTMMAPILGGIILIKKIPTTWSDQKPIRIFRQAATAQMDDYLDQLLTEHIKTWKTSLDTISQQTNHRNFENRLDKDIWLDTLRTIFISSFTLSDPEETAVRNQHYDQFVDGLKKIIQANITGTTFSNNKLSEIPQNDYFTIFKDKIEGYDFDMGDGQKYIPDQIVNTLTAEEQKSLVTQFLTGLKKVFVDDFQQDFKPRLSIHDPAPEQKWYDKIPEVNAKLIESGVDTSDFYQKVLDLLLTTKDNTNLMIQHLGLKNIGHSVIQKLKEQMKNDEQKLKKEITSKTVLVRNINPYVFYFPTSDPNWIGNQTLDQVLHNLESKWSNVLNNAKYFILANINSGINLVRTWIEKTNLTQTSKPRLKYLLRWNNAYNIRTSSNNTTVNVETAVNEIKKFLESDFKTNTFKYLNIQSNNFGSTPRQIGEDDIIFTPLLNNLITDFPISVNKQLVVSDDDQAMQVRVKLSVTIKPELKDANTTNQFAKTFDVIVELKTTQTG